MSLQQGQSEIFRHIASVARTFGDLLHSRLFKHALPRPAYREPHPVLDLPLDIQSLELTIQQLPIPHSSRSWIQNNVSTSLAESRRIYIESYQRTCERLCTLPEAKLYMDHTQRLYQANYSKHVERIQTLLSDVAAVAAQQRDRGQKSQRPTFNTESTPILEEYFQTNAYPTSSERARLAKETMMTTRQIEVWFQNHRNRAKKDGKILRRSKHNPVQRSHPQLADTQTPLHYHQSYGHDFCQSPPPPYAFPAPFNPHQKHQRTQFSAPQWNRHSTSSAPARSTPAADTDELVSLFARLSLSPDCPKRRPREASAETWFSSRVCVPCRAPLPALIPSLSTPSPSFSAVPPNGQPSCATTSLMTRQRALPYRAPRILDSPAFSSQSPSPFGFGMPTSNSAPPVTVPSSPVSYLDLPSSSLPPWSSPSFGSRTPSLSSVDTDAYSYNESGPATPPTGYLSTLVDAWQPEDVDFDSLLHDLFSDHFAVLQDPILPNINLDLNFGNLSDSVPAVFPSTRSPQPSLCETPFPLSLPALNMYSLPC